MNQNYVKEFYFNDYVERKSNVKKIDINRKKNSKRKNI